MNYDYEQTDFSKAILAGLFAGLGATLVNLAYDYFFRQVTEFSLSQIVNVGSIIFVSTLLVSIAGLIFHLFKHYIKNGGRLYSIVFTVITLLCLYGAMHVQRSDDPVQSAEFRELISGFIISIGVAAVSIPYLVKHNKIFS